MKRVSRNIVLTVLIFVMLFSVVGCANLKNSSDIKKLMNNFESSCNELDINGILDCINPSIADKIKLAVGIVGTFTDTPTDELIDVISGALTSDSSIIGTEFFESIKIEVEDIEIVEDNATVTTVLSYTIADETYEKSAVFECIYYTGEWYISNFNIN